MSSFLDWSEDDLDKLLGLDAQGNISPAYIQLAMVDAKQYYPDLYRVLKGLKKVSKQELDQIVDNRIRDGMYKMERYFASATAKGSAFNLEDWQKVMSIELRNMHIQAYLLGRNADETN